MRRAAPLLVPLAFLLPAAAQAGTLDQSQTTRNASRLWGTDTRVAQTFTAGRTGQLDQVDLWLRQSCSLGPTIEVQIYGVGGDGAPAFPLLASTNILTNQFPTSPADFAVFPVVFGAPANVAAGKQYSVVLVGNRALGGCTADHAWQWGAATGNPYPGGRAFSSTGGGAWVLQGDAVAGDLDFTFRTYVADPSAAPPKPAPLDQVQTQPRDDGIYRGFQGTTTVAQTFTAGRDGHLFQVDVDLRKNCASSGVTAELRNVSADGRPSSSVLGSGQIDDASVPGSFGLVPAALSPATVAAGSHYAIVLSATSAGRCAGSNQIPYLWAGSAADPYKGGFPWSSPDAGATWFMQGQATDGDFDFRFQTYVQPVACADGADNDGDGLVDLADPGCVNAADDDEVNQPVACADGADNDGDGLVDLADPGCVNAADDDEVNSSDSPGAPGSCGGEQATSTGTDAGETLRGTAGVDVIAGLGGADDLFGGGAADTICGGSGRDQLVGNGGGDRLLGGPGNDVLRGKSGKDFLIGGGGRDRCIGGPGADRERSC